MSKGMFVVVEGVDCSGKSTLVKLLTEALEAEGEPVLLTGEPTHDGYGKEIRDAAERGLRLGLERELELFMRDRAEHVSQIVKPALREGKIVICDRYYFSSAVYQGMRMPPFGAGLILAANRAVFPEPDLLVVLTLRPEKVQERIKILRGGVTSPFEEDIPKVFEAFEDIARRYRGPKCILDTEHAPPEVLVAWVMDAIRTHRGESGSPEVKQ